MACRRNCLTPGEGSRRSKQPPVRLTPLGVDQLALDPWATTKNEMAHAHTQKRPSQSTRIPCKINVHVHVSSNNALLARDVGAGDRMFQATKLATTGFKIGADT